MQKGGLNMSSDFERMKEFADSINWDGLEQWEKDAIWESYDHEELLEELELEAEWADEEQTGGD